MTRWSAPLTLTRALLVGLCVCWPSYTSAEGTGRDLSPGEAQLQVVVEKTRLAAERGGASAQFDLGLSVEKTRLAAEQGDASAQFDLGLRYATGRGVPKDETEAVRWYRLAADQGNADAQGNLGIMYANGRGVPQDDVAAHMWFDLAAAQPSTYRAFHAKGRDDVAKGMTPEQIAEAQRLAREWKPTVEP